MVKFEHLLGREFNIETANCYTILRDFYRDNWGVELPDVPCPTEWWNSDLNLYAELAPKIGFEVIHEHPRDWRPGDVILMAIGSSTGNHIAIVLDGGSILHHLHGQRSVVTSYGGTFRNTTVGVYRHRDVPKTSTVHNVDLKALNLPPHVRHRLEDFERRAAGLSD